MATKDPAPPQPSGAPAAGEAYRHYKGESYRVVGIALNSFDETWDVIYEPLYDGAVSRLFSRPVSQWIEVVEWEGKQVPRFVKI